MFPARKINTDTKARDSGTRPPHPQAQITADPCGQLPGFKPLSPRRLRRHTPLSVSVSRQRSSERKKPPYMWAVPPHGTGAVHRHQGEEKTKPAKHGLSLCPDWDEVGSFPHTPPAMMLCPSSRVRRRAGPSETISQSKSLLCLNYSVRDFGLSDTKKTNTFIGQ